MLIANVNLQFEQTIQRKRKKQSKKAFNLKEKILNKFSYLFYFLLVRLKMDTIDKVDFLPPMKD